MLIETDNIVLLHEIAEIAGVGPSAVSNWRKRHARFPQPVAVLGTKQSNKRGRDNAVELFDLEAIHLWLMETARLPR